MSSVSVLPPDPATLPAAAEPAARAQGLFPGLSRPVQVEIGPALARVAAVVPCHDRPGDARALLADLANLDRTGIDLRIILVDNASAEPLANLPAPSGLSLEHLRLNTNTGGSGGFSAGLALALASPSTDAYSPDHPWAAFDAEFVWLVDSDARVQPDTLGHLLAVLRSNPRIVAAGPAIADPLTDQCFELGGHLNRRTGMFEPLVPGAAGVSPPSHFPLPPPHLPLPPSHLPLPPSHFPLPTSAFPLPPSHLPLVPCDYLASCCALVRADAARCAGPFPDTFLNGDDVEWFIRMAQRTGGAVVAVPWARAHHPRFDRFPTWTRYYTTRNAHAPIDAIAAPRSAKLRRALRDVLRAAQQHMVGRHDLARLHLLGLAHAAAGRTTGPAPDGTIHVRPALPPAKLIDSLRDRLGTLSGRRVAVHPALGIPDSDRAAILDSLAAAGCAIAPLPANTGARAMLSAAVRWLFGPRADIALIPARGRPDSWFAGSLLVALAPGPPVSCSIQSPSRIGAPARAAWALAIGFARAVRISRRRARGPDQLDLAYRAARARANPVARALSVEAVVLSHNRWPALETTIERLLASPSFDGSCSDPGVPRSITIIDNGSRDGTPERVETFLTPRGVKLIRLDSNIGVDAFNKAVAPSTADAVLILDDDAVPDDDALLIAIDELASRPALGAVTLHPRDPKTGRSEWPFVSGKSEVGSRKWKRDPTSHSPLPTSAFPLPTSHFPIMGCANLVRRTSWNHVGGYEPAFFLYRNDADLALKLLAAGEGVYFSPALIVWHDTPAGPGQPKSPRWHELATRNWIWMARRHGSRAMGILPMGLGVLPGALLGWLWAHKLAGLSIERHLATLRGAWAGLAKPAPKLNAIAPDGSHWRRLINLRLRRSEK